jgi:uncharacterized protein
MINNTKMKIGVFMLTRASLLALAVGGASTLAQAADNLIISEYVEGSSNNKAIELYNPTAASIDLNQYLLSFYFNGSTQAGSKIALSGVLAPGATYVIADNDASADILARANLISNASFFNGDDAIVLSAAGQIVDSLGRVGEDPGSEWGSGDLSTQDNTLRRDPKALIADTVIDDVVTLSTWLGFAKDDISDLGKFSAEPSGPTDPLPNSLICGEAATPIHAIQGTAQVSPLKDQLVTVEAIVTSNLEAGLKGLFLQMADNEADADPLSSEGVFVYTGNVASNYLPGDRIRVQAKVAEYQGLTQLTSVSAHTLCAGAQALPTPAQLTLPLQEVSQLEAFEGMSVSFSQPLVVNDVYNLGRYGEIKLGSKRHFIGTQVASPGSDALAVSQANARDSILLDDGLTSQNPDPVRYPAPGLSATNTVRIGDKVLNLNAVMHYGFGVYRLMPTETVNFITENPRTTTPEITEGDLKLASFNVLNYFNGDGLGGGFPTDRGAHTQTEFERQKAKIVSAMLGIDADIIGLMEIENDGFGPNSAIADLVAGLNTAIGEERYQYVDPGVAAIGTDAISVGIIYRADRVTPVGAAAILSSANSALDEAGKPLFDDGKNRPTLAQGFGVKGFDDNLVLAVNHLKSKGSDCASIGDPDLKDGQGNCNLTRSRAAKAVADWLADQFPQQPVLLIGDLNSYAKEDPLTTLGQAGYTELFEHLGKADAYSYVFSGESGQLDHALANGIMLDKVVDVTEWHINTDEPRILDYNEEFKSAQQLTELYAATPYRSSDHDPVVISLALTPENIAPVASFNLSQAGSNVTLTSTSFDTDGELVDFLWDLGDGSLVRGESLSHSYSASGDYLVTLTVIDNLGLSHSVSQTVSVTLAVGPQAPVAQIQYLNLGLVHVFISTGSDRDGYIKKHQWRFNDGRHANGVVSWRFAKPDLNSVELTVRDNDRLQASTALRFR